MGPKTTLILLLFLFSAITIQAQYRQVKDTIDEKEILKLPMPVRNGFVYTKPPSTMHCIGSGILVYSYLKKDSVVSLLPGEVVTKVNLDGAMAIIIQTGDYFITYSGMAEDCHLKKGDAVTKNQFLFNLIQTDENSNILSVLIADKNKSFYLEDCIRFIEEQLLNNSNSKP